MYISTSRYYHETRLANQICFLIAVQVSARNRLTLPRQIARALRLKKGGPLLMRLVSRKFELVPIPRAQLWFWTPEWQRKEREADEDIAQGRVKGSTSVDELLKGLKS